MNIKTLDELTKDVRRLHNRITTYFDNKKIYQILLKVNNHTELTENEKQELDYWILAYNYRDKLYNKLKKVLELQIEVSAAKGSEIINVARKIKDYVPKRYGDYQIGSSYDQMQSALQAGLKEFSSEIVLKLIRGKLLGAIFFLGVIFIALSAFVFFIIRFSK